MVRELILLPQVRCAAICDADLTEALLQEGRVIWTPTAAAYQPQGAVASVNAASTECSLEAAAAEQSHRQSACQSKPRPSKQATLRTHS